MKENLKKANIMDKVSSYIKMEINILESSKKIKKTGKELIYM